MKFFGGYLCPYVMEQDLWVGDREPDVEKAGVKPVSVIETCRGYYFMEGRVGCWVWPCRLLRRYCAIY